MSSMVKSAAKEHNSCLEHLELANILKRLLEASLPGMPVPVKLLLLLHALGDQSHKGELSRRLRALVLSRTLPPSQFHEADRLYCSNTLTHLEGLTNSWAAPVAVPTLIDTSFSFSESPRWRQQRDYYEKCGIAAWQTSSESAVPFSVSSNSFAAKRLVQLALNFAIDHKLDQLTILELGAGHCLCSYHMASYISDLDTNLRIKVVASDFNELIIRSTMEHPCLSRLRTKGILDFAIVNDTSTLQPIHLLSSGENLTGALFVVANYLVDSIPTDVFLTCGGSTIYELREREDSYRKRKRRDPSSAKVEAIDLWPYDADTAAFSEPWQKDVLDFVRRRKNGIHLIPWGFGHLVSRLHQAVGPSFPFAITVSDVPFAFDDPNCVEVDENSGSWACPQISPSSDALALPVDFEVLTEMFKRCRGGGTDSHFECTSSLLASFGTLVLCDRPAMNTLQTFRATNAVLNSLSLEECRLFLTKSPLAAQHATLAELMSILRMFSCEFSLFVSLQWNIAQKVLVSEYDESLEDTILNCLANCDARMSENSKDRSKTRRDIMRFLYAINKHAILHLLHEFSGGEKVDQRHERVDSLMRDENNRCRFEQCATLLPPWSDVLPKDAADELYIIAKICSSNKAESERLLRRALDIFPTHRGATRALRGSYHALDN